MKVLIACEESGRVRDEFLSRGHDAVSLDLLETSSPGPHLREPLTESVLSEGWDLIVAFPPCTRLSCIGAAWWKRWQEDGSQRDAFDFVQMIWNAPCDRVAIENPIGWMNTNWRKPDQIIDPWQFGDPYRKRTCLWLRGVMPLTPLVDEMPDDVEHWVTWQRRAKDPVTGLRKYSKAEESGIRANNNRDRSKIRSKTFPGIARAMADAWG